MGKLRRFARQVGLRVAEEVTSHLARRLGVPSSADTQDLAVEVAPPSDRGEEVEPAWTPVDVSTLGRPKDLVQIGQPRRPDGPARLVRAVPTIDDGARAPELEAVDDGEVIRVLAEPVDEKTCRLHIGHTFAGGHGWWFSEPDKAPEAPLAEALFSLDLGLEKLLVDDRTVTLHRAESSADWRKTAKAAANVIRAHLRSGHPPLPAALTDRIPDESEVRRRIVTALAEEVNPGVAAHEGRVDLERVRGNSVWIWMGGGCQGCSAASQTLQGGIDGVLRRAVPELAGIYDVTDHAAGESPFFR